MAKNVWDGFGHRIGSISNLPDKKHVYNGNGQPLGNVGRDGTFTVNSKLVSRTPMAGLLFNRGKTQGSTFPHLNTPMIALFARNSRTYLQMR